MATPSVTPKIVQVPDVGNIQFPGDMSDDQIASAIKRNYPQLGQPNKSPITERITPGPKSAISANAPVSSLALGMAGGLGIPETKTPVSDLLDAINPISNTKKIIEASKQGDILPLIAGPAGAGIVRTAKNYLQGGAEDLSNAGIRNDAVRADNFPVYTRDMAKQEVMGNVAPGRKYEELNGPQQRMIDAYTEQRFRQGLRPSVGDVNYPLIAQGLTKMAAGAVPVVGPAAYESGSEIEQGIHTGDVDTALHGVGKGAGTVLGLLLGTKRGQALTEQALEKTVRPAVGKVSAIPAKATSATLGGGVEAMQKRPLPQQTAAGGASNLEVTQYAKEHGIDLLPGQATQARGLKTLQAIGERAIVAPGELPQVLEQQKANFGNLVDDFKGRVGTEAIPDTEAAGASLKSQAQHGLDTLKASAQADYQAFQQKIGDIPVDLSDVKSKYADRLASQSETLRNLPNEYAGPVKNVLNRLAGIEAGPPADPKALADFKAAVESYGLNPEQQAKLRTNMGLPPEAGNANVGMSTAQQLRSAYLDIARDYPGNVPKAVQRLAGEAANDIDKAMATAADKVGATQQWRQANAKWKQLQETYNSPDHPLYKVLQEPDATKVPSRLLGKGSYGGSPVVVRKLKQAGIDLSPLKREVAQQIADKNFSLTNGGRGMAGYSTPFLQELFSPAEFDELTKIGRIGRAISFETNPSGTSNVMEGSHQLHSIVKGSIGATVGPLASRITTSKALARAAMGDISSAPRGVTAILGGPPQPPELPPEPGGSVPPNDQNPPRPVSPRSTMEILSGPESLVKRPEPYTGPERRSPGRNLTSRIGEFRKELLGETDPAKRAELQRAIDREIAVETGKASTPEPHTNLPSTEEVEKHFREAPPIAEYRRGLNSTPEGMIRSAGLKSLGELSPGTGVYQFEDPANPGKTASMSLADMQKGGIEGIKAKMQAKLAEMKNTPSLADILSRGASKPSVHEMVRDIRGESSAPIKSPEMRAGEAVAGNYGSDTQVKTTSTSLPAKYKVVEADSLIPSHNAQTFAKSPQYPEGVQERAYHSSKEAQNRVIQQTQNYDPAYTVNTNPDAVNGPPVITKDGIVLGGNSRTMSTQRLYKSGRGDAYKNYLRANAAQFGMNPTAIDNMRSPVLVREVETPANTEAARRIGADLNRSMTGSLGVGEKSVSAGRSVKPATLASISDMVNGLGEGATLRDAMRQHGKEIVRLLEKDGVISERERPQFIDTATGGLNGEGKTFVERALIGSVVDDPQLMDRTPKSVLGKLEGSLGDLSAVGARTDEYNLLPLVREALADHAEMAMRGLDVDRFLNQQGMFGPQRNPAVDAMVRMLADKPKAFRGAMQQFAKDAKFDQQGQGILGLGMKPSAPKAFNDAFGTSLTDEQFHDALLQSAGKEGTIAASGQPDQSTRGNEGLRNNPAPQASPGSPRKTTAAQGSREAANPPQAVTHRTISDIIGNRKSKRKQ